MVTIESPAAWTEVITGTGDNQPVRTMAAVGAPRVQVSFCLEVDFRGPHAHPEPHVPLELPGEEKARTQVGETRQGVPLP